MNICPSKNILDAKSYMEKLGNIKIKVVYVIIIHLPCNYMLRCNLYLYNYIYIYIFLFLFFYSPKDYSFVSLLDEGIYSQDESRCCVDRRSCH